MKVYIGPYKSWIGPYQIADLLQHFGVSKDKCHSIGERLSETWLNDFCQWIDSKRKRAVKIKIDNYDVWSLDSTLAYIIVPALHRLKEQKHGSGGVDDSDVPENIRRTSAKPMENEWDTDEFFHDRWDHVLNEMIWAFEQLHPDSDSESQFYSGEPDFEFVKVENSELSQMVSGSKNTFKVDHEGLKAHNDRINNGLRLFGKYYRGLWD